MLGVNIFVMHTLKTLLVVDQYIVAFISIYSIQWEKSISSFNYLQSLKYKHVHIFIYIIIYYT
jgi:hypothetical protein